MRGTTKPELRLVESGLPSLIHNIEDFLYAKSVWRASTITFYQVPLRQYVDHVGRHFWPPTDSSINSFLAAVRARGCKESTIFAYYRALKTWLGWLHKRGRIEQNPIELVEKPPKPRPVPRAPDETDINRLFDYLEAMAYSGEWIKIRDLALLSLALDTGIRRGELARLKEKDIDFTNRSISISPDSKTHRGRIIRFSSVVAGDLDRWLKKRSTLNVPPSLRSMWVAVGGKRHEWHAITPNGIYQILKRKLKQAKVDHFRFHSLRSAYIIYALRNGADPEDVRRQVGHLNLSTTGIYAQAALDYGRGERHEQSTPRKRRDK